MLIPIREGQPPVAAAGNDQTVQEGDIVTFNGLGSSDNFAVVNYTWSFTYDGSPVHLYGASPSFQFLIAGTYVVTLNASDQAGNTGTDTVVVTVEILIPEFPTLVLPVCGLLAAALVISWRRRRGD
jgi:PKD repeat protein